MTKRDSVSPCKDCLDRYLGCHSDCEKYITWKDVHEKALDAIRADKDKTVDADAFLVNQHRKYKKSIFRVSKKGGYKG